MKKIKSAWISLCMLAVLVLTICMPSDVGYAASDYSFIRVLLSTPHNTAAHTITVAGSYTIKEKADYKVTAGKYTVKLNGATVQLVKDGVTTDIGTKCTFVPASYTDLGNLITVDKASSRKYLGDIIFYKNKFKTNGNLVDKLHVVNRVPMEQYLYGVIGAEIGAGSHMEALKTQAVAARGYAINQLAPSEPNYEVTDTTAYQAYVGYSNNARVKQAVDETKGQVVTYNGKICMTFFGASNGGQTELPGNAFGGGSSKNAQYPYLAQKDDPYDVKNTASKSQVLYIPKQIDTVSESGITIRVQSGRTGVRIRSAASTSSSILATVNGGAAYPYVGETGDWYIITYNGTRAYISKTFCDKISGGSTGSNFPYSYDTEQLKALQKAAYQALGSSVVSSQNNVQLVSVESLENGTEQWPGTGSRCYATATAVLNVRYLNNSGNVITKNRLSCTLTLLNKSNGNYTYKHDYLNESLRMRGVEPVKENGTTVGWNLTARRWGHGVGMSQRGTQTRANEGQTYQQILAFYFDKTTLTTVDTGTGAEEIDTVAPTVEALTVDGGEPIYTKKFTVRAVGVKDSGGIDHVRFAVWNGENGQDDLTYYDGKDDGNGTYSIEVDTGNHKNQIGDFYYVRAYPVDKAGNEGWAGTSFRTLVDTTPPTASAENLTANGKDTIDTKQFTLKLTGAADSGSGIASVQFVVWNGENGQDDVKIYTAKDEGSGTYSVEINTADHNNQVEDYYYVQAVLTDKAGNQQTIEKSFKSDIDITPPVGSEITVTPQKAESEFTVRAKITDAQSGVKSVTSLVWCASVGGQDDLAACPVVNEGNGYYSMTVKASDHKNQLGWYYVRMYAEDYAGNKSTVVLINQAAEITGDVTPPTASAENLKANGKDTIDSEHFTLRITGVTDSGSGMDYVQMAVWNGENGQDDLKYYMTKDEGNGAYSVDISTADHKNQTGDYYYVRVYPVDKAGNKGWVGKSFKTEIAGKDTTPPVGSEITVTPQKAESEFTVRAKITDAQSGVKSVTSLVWCASVGGQDDLAACPVVNEGNGYYSMTVKASDHKNQLGWYYVRMYAEDYAGNKSTVVLINQAAEITGDVTPPEASAENLKANGKDTIDSEHFTLRITGVTDSGSGMDYVQMAVWNGENGQDDLKYYMAKDEGNGAYSVDISTADHKNQTGDYYYVRVYPVDKAGNKGWVGKSFKTEITGKDTTPPQVICTVTNGSPVTEDHIALRLEAEDIYIASAEVLSPAVALDAPINYGFGKLPEDDCFTLDIALVNYLNAKGTYVIEVTAEDRAGNKSTSKISVPVAYDYNKTGTMTATNVNVRAGASVELPSLGKLRKGQTVRVLAQTDTLDEKYPTWIAIDYNGKLGYVVSKYIEITDTTTSAQRALFRMARQLPVQTQQPAGEEDLGYVKVASQTAAIRKSAAVQADQIGTAHEGETYRYLGEEEGWYLVEYNGQKAYISWDDGELG
ncbi:MAG: GBS Bsp-like repeat-containing protein [Christensenellales bacterium]